jgi:predicted AAA+ superfamily ATPase
MWWNATGSTQVAALRWLIRQCLLIAAFDTSGRSNIGHALETVVLNELERRKARVAYVKTAEGFEVDFHAWYLTGVDELVQVCADPSTPETQRREMRALTQASREMPHAARRLLVLSRDQSTSLSAPGIEVQPAYEWLLGPAARD